MVSLPSGALDERMTHQATSWRPGPDASGPETAVPGPPYASARINELARAYRLSWTVSWSSSSDVVMTRALAW